MWGSFGIIPTINHSNELVNLSTRITANQFYHYNELYHDNVDQHQPFNGNLLKVIFPIAWAAVAEDVPVIPQFVVY